MRQNSLVFLILWHLCAAALIVLLPSVELGPSFWSLPGPDQPLTVDLALAYLAAAGILTVAVQRRERLSGSLILGTTLSALALALVYFLVSRRTVGLTRSAFAAMIAAALVLAVLGFRLRRLRLAALVGLVLVVAAAVGLNLLRDYRAHHRKTVQSSESYLTSAFYDLRIVNYADVVPRTDHWGGGLARFGDDFLLASGDGRLYVLQLNSAKRSLQVKPLSYRVPLDIAEFDASVHALPPGVEVHSDQADRIHAVQSWQFRVADVLTQEFPDRIRVFASHHFWNKEKRCFGARVSQMEASREDWLSGHAAASWKTIFEAVPCLPLEGPDAVQANNPFAGMEIGGRMRLRDAHTLMLTLGDHDFTGLETKRMLAQDPNSSYGKTLLIHLDDLSSEIYSMGHRNPQGLYVQPDGTTWETEHGPQGGDELNLIEKGRNYGWPLVTYGTDYGAFGWPLSRSQGRHEGFEKPIFAWVPSIATSNLVRVESDRFPLWKGDLLVSSLHGKSVFRLRLEDRRVLYAEPLEIGQRLRDILEARDGTILLWTDHSDLFTIEPASGSSGTALFASRCGGCHKTADGETHSYGPDLFGVVGRKVAAARGFDGYSPALRSLGGSWSAARLDQFIRNPQAFAPGTSMTFTGVSDANERAAIIEYLQSRH